MKKKSELGIYFRLCTNSFLNYYFSAPSPGIELVYTDLKLMVKDIQPTSAFIEWRVFSFNEKPLIDGVQIRLCTPSCAPAGKK